MYYIWLTPEGAKKMEMLEGVAGSAPRVATNTTSGNKYIEVYGDISDPTVEFPNIVDPDIIKKVTARSVIYRGLRTEGVYRYDGATLTVVTEISDGDPMMGIMPKSKQLLNISAPTVEAVKAIYTMVRQGELRPDENWEAPDEASSETEETEAV